MKFNSYSYKGTSRVFKLLFILGCSVSMSSCQWGDQIESLVQPNPDDFAVLFSDTTTVELSTVGSDSLMTGGPARMLVGNYTDPYFGKVRAVNFFQPTTDGISIPTLAEYDSLVLSLKYDGYYYGDTTKPLNLSVHRLQSDIFERSSYWNGSSTPYDPVAIGKTRLTITPDTSKSLRIKISDELGKQIFEMGKNNLLNSSTEWINLVKGLVIMPALSDNSPVIGFQSGSRSTSLQLHYHTPEVDRVKKDSTLFAMRGSYNQILGDRKGTALAGLPDTKRISLPSAKSANMSFIQAGTGIMTRVDFPFLRNLRAVKFSVANRAFLRVTPLRASVTDQLPAPPQLYVYRCDKNNEFYTDANGAPVPLYYLSSSSLTPVVGSYVNDLVTNKQYYLIDVSSYVSDLMNSENDDIGGLILRTSAFNTSSSFRDADTGFSKSVNRLVIGNQQHGDPGVKLELYYTTVKAE